MAMTDIINVLVVGKGYFASEYSSVVYMSSLGYVHIHTCFRYICTHAHYNVWLGLTYIKHHYCSSKRVKLKTLCGTVWSCFMHKFGT